MLVGLISVGPGQRRQEINQVYYAMDSVDGIARAYVESGDEIKLRQDIAAFNVSDSHTDFFMALSQNGALVYPAKMPENVPSVAFAGHLDGGSYVVSEGAVAVVTEAGSFRLVLVDLGQRLIELDHQLVIGADNPVKMFRYGLLAIGMFVLVILLTNVALTRRMYKSIMVPLAILVDGVHQIRDGNLAYRITYTGRDEFAGIADDFNEMAGYLHKLVTARLQDNENRKELVAGISHDLRTPLTAIKAYVEGLETGVAATPETQRKYLRIIKSKTADMEHIVSQLFLFSKLDVGDFPLALEKVPLGPMMARFVEGVREDYREKGLHLVMQDTQAQSGQVLLDAVQFRSVLINVLENSLRYGKAQGGEMQIDLKTRGQTAEITLTDNGPGVPSGALDRLFEVFYRADSSRVEPGKSSGLGLAISAKIIEQFGGAIKAENAPAGGLSVIIILPLAKETSHEKSAGD